MKICFLAGANSVHSVRWIKYFAEKGHEVHWISLTPCVECEIKNIKLYLTPHPIGGWKLRIIPVFHLLFNIFWVRKLVKKIKPDILHSHYVGVNGLVGALTGFHPFILTAWGSDILIGGKLFIKKSLIKFTLDRADLTTCDGENIENSLSNFGINSEKIKTIYFGIDIEKFNLGPENEEIKIKLKIANSPVVLNLRNLEPIYDVETLINAVPLVIKEIPEAKFIIAGKGSQKGKLKKMAEDLKCLENVRFIGWISHDELPKYLKTADIYVSTSLSDSTSVSLLEAMSCGLTPIVTEIGENKKILNNGEYGLLIPIKNSNILAQKIIYLLKNDEVRNKIGRQGREIVEKKYNYYKEMNKMENIYKNLIKTKL